MTGPFLDGIAIGRIRRIGGDALVSNMVNMFLEHGAERVAAIRAAAEAGDVKAVEHIAHSLKSSAGNLGGTRLQETAEMLEQKAAQGVIDDDCAARITREFDETAAALRRTLEEPAP